MSWDSIINDVMNRIWLHFDMDDDLKYSRWFKKVIHFIGYKFLPLMVFVAGSIIFYMIIFRIYNASGYEKTMIILLIILIITIRSIRPKDTVPKKL